MPTAFASMRPGFYTRKSKMYSADKNNYHEASMRPGFYTRKSDAPGIGSSG